MYKCPTVHCLHSIYLHSPQLSHMHTHTLQTQSTAMCLCATQMEWTLLPWQHQWGSPTAQYTPGELEYNI